MDRYQRMQQLLHDLPPQYLNNELRIMILERSIETLHELVQLNRDSKYESYLKNDIENLKQIREQNPNFPPVAVNNEAKAKEVRSNLEILFRFIESQHRNKRLTAPVAKKYLDFIKLSICQSKADMFCSRAESAKAKGKPRVAIHNYHSAIDAYKALSEHPQALKAIQQLRINIKALEAEAEQQTQSLKTTPEPEKENTEWDSFLKDDNSWQKKNTYDD